MMQLTSSTAPGTYFTSREELAAHYHSDWHKYNLRRRQAGLPPVTAAEFQAKLSAARTVQQEKNVEKSRAHLKNKKNDDKKKTATKKDRTSAPATTATAASNKRDEPPELAQPSSQGDADLAVGSGLGAVTMESSTDPAAVLLHVGSGETSTVTQTEDRVAVAPADNGTDVVVMTARPAPNEHEDETMDDSNSRVEIDPQRCLFDRHLSSTVQDNLSYMNRTYGFFVPDVEHLVDMKGLVGYCHEKIQLGRTCLWCQQLFGTAEACVSHMKSKNHTKIRYEADVDLDEYDVFYDFSASNREFMATLNYHGDGGIQLGAEGASMVSGNAHMQVDQDDDSDGEWEDMSEDDDNDHEVDDDYQGYEEQVGQMGITITDLGEIVFPDGRVVGHRNLRRYYKQNLAPYYRRKDGASIAVRAARRAAGERLYNGRVYNIHTSTSDLVAGGRAMTASNKMAAAMGFRAPTGRTGQGILVPVASSSANPSASSSSSALASPLDYSKLSIYRYRAALRKAKYGENYGRRLWLRSNTNMNKMDKKANRLANGVSVAHAAR